ncbi:NADH-ubiquinone oxidoreductase chain M [Candidatus Rhodobacter oscarellae]|uniref:NADH-ubiquinone oxidoreductase chain M n=1 Tax=Candidatus Rhodobacter oscarellae TaxID=1675527 RepID=A0A0J9EDW8_9RHOB|nr:NADH-quinone oxidoreductase subunit M [Candidatus Rhodobacter lobularis]KMW59929.1 NADH-ubiquinone oxidoreductase chain M [Candidatus Rhodobacter lobularis]
MLPEISASAQIGFPILSLLVFLPAIVAVVIQYLKESSALATALVVSAFQLVLAGMVWWVHDPASAAIQLAENGLLPGYTLGVDGVSAMFLPATALLSLFAVVYATKSVTSNLRGYLAALLFSQAALMGAFAATNLTWFWIFFVAEIFPAYYLIKSWGTSERRYDVARNYLTYMGLSALALGIGFLLMATSVQEGATFNLIAIANGTIDPTLQTLIFFVLCLGFAIKAPLFPLHSWLPKVLEHGPLIGMSVFLVGIKLGAYGLIRFVIPLLPEAAAEWYWLMAAFGFASLVYGALIALVQTNLRRLMAFASVSHMGVVTLGLFSLNVAGIEGGLLQALNLGITGAGLFLIASFLSSRVGTPDLSQMGGIHARAPYLALGFLVIALAAVGMPGTSGFNGEHMVLLGAFEKHWLMAVCVGIGPVLAAAYFLRFYQRGFLGEPAKTESGEERVVLDLDGRERFIVGGLVAVVLWIGLATTPFISTMRGSVEAISATFHPHDADKAHAHAEEADDATGDETLLASGAQVLGGETTD